jgi:hypothetical protein
MHFILQKKFLFVLVILCTLAYLTAGFYATQAWGAVSFLLVIGLFVLTQIIGGLSLRTTAFAAIAMLPNLNSFVPFPGFSLTWSETFMLLFCLVFVVKEARLMKNKFAFFASGLFVICMFSLVGSPIGLLAVGLLVRFAVLLLFTIIIVSMTHESTIIKPVFYGILAIPFVACATYWGEGVLFDMFSANILQFSRAVYSFQYPIWFSFIIPVAIFFKMPKPLLIFIYLFVGYLIAFSFSRSIIVGTFAAGVLFIVFFRSNKRLTLVFTKAILIATFAVLIFVVTVALQFFEFSNMDNGSNVTRYEKMYVAVENIKRHPFLGSGFGASQDKALAEKRSGAEVFSDLISPEFGPLTVTAEIGILGFIFLFGLICVSLKHSISCLQDKELLVHNKLVVLITFGGFISTFLNSNSTASLIIYIFLAIPIVINKKCKWDLQNHNAIYSTGK